MATHAAPWIGLLSLGAAGIAWAQAPSTPPAFASPDVSERGMRALAAHCATCHGSARPAEPGSMLTSLAGRSDIADLMKAFKEGERKATLMREIAKGFGDAEIAALGEYFAKQPR